MIQGDLKRARALAADAGLDALLAFTPRNVGHLTGFSPANQNTTGVFWALLPVDPALPTMLTVGEFDLVWARQRAAVDDIGVTGLWIEIVDLPDLKADRLTIRPKPVQFDPAAMVASLAAALEGRKLGHSRIGTDFGGAHGRLVDTLRRELPEVEFVAADEVFSRSRQIKSAAEIEALRSATQLTELGIRAALMDQDPRGRTVSQLRATFERSVLDAVSSDPECAGYEQSRVYLSTGGDIGPNLTRHGQVVADGDVIWIDAGCQVDGYACDIGRTFSIGRASPLVRRIADALTAGSQAGLPLLRAGIPMGEVYRTTQDTVRANGLPTYTRGHFGHAVGIGIGERGPYVSAGNEQPFEPGMTMAYERPYYVRGLGGFQFEENFAVTGDGPADLFTTLPQELIEI